MKIECSRINFRNRKWYKYTLQKQAEVDLGVNFTTDIRGSHFELTTGGHLTILEHYSWDGPSGPVLDTKWNIRASLVHDALYQMIRERYFSNADDAREMADWIFRVICEQDGVRPLVAAGYFRVLRWAGAGAAKQIPANCVTIGTNQTAVVLPYDKPPVVT